MYEAHSNTRFKAVCRVCAIGGLVAWHSGNALCLINKVTLHWVRLVLRWVTACRQINHLGI